MIAAIEGAVSKAAALGVGVGVFARTPVAVSHWIACGVKFIAVSEDTAVILDAFSALRSHIGQ